MIALNPLAPASPLLSAGQELPAEMPPLQPPFRSMYDDDDILPALQTRNTVSCSSTPIKK